jgi:hypothetical protein
MIDTFPDHDLMKQIRSHNPPVSNYDIWHQVSIAGLFEPINTTGILLRSGGRRVSDIYLVDTNIWIANSINYPDAVLLAEWGSDLTGHYAASITPLRETSWKKLPGFLISQENSV